MIKLPDFFQAALFFYTYTTVVGISNVSNSSAEQSVNSQNDFCNH